MKPAKAERREGIRRNQSKMGVSGRSVFRLLRVIQQKANKVKEVK